MTCISTIYDRDGFVQPEVHPNWESGIRKQEVMSINQVY